jgi:hypothetical protein
MKITLKAVMLLSMGWFLLATAPLAKADLEMMVGSTTIVGSGGAVNFAGPSGTFYVVASGTSKPITLGSTLNLMQFDVSSATGGTLTFELTDTDFTGAIGSIGTMLASGNFVSGGGTITYDAYIGNDNLVFDQGSHVGTIASLNGSTSGGSITSNPFSLTEVVTVNLNPGSMLTLQTSLTDPVAAPEADSSVILGFCISSLLGGFWVRRRINVVRNWIG